MKELIEQMIIECHESMVECIKNDQLDMAIKYQQLISDYKEQLQRL